MTKNDYKTADIRHNAAIKLQPLKETGQGANHAALDAYKRLRLGSLITEQLGVKGRVADVYVSVDPAQKIIAVARPDDVTQVPNASLYRVNKEGYIRTRAIYDTLGLPVRRHTFSYVGPVESSGLRWVAFRLDTDDE